MKRRVRWMRAVVTAAAAAAMLAAAPGRTIAQTSQKSVTVRVGTLDGCRTIVQQFAGTYSRTHPGVRVEVIEGGGFRAATGLALGLADLAVLYGPPDVLEHPWVTEARGFSFLKKVFEPNQIRTVVIARRAMAVAVHPTSPLAEMDSATIQAIFRSFEGTGEGPHPDPPGVKGARYLRNLWTTADMIRLIGGGTNDRYPFAFGRMPSLQPRDAVWAEVARDANLVAFITAEDGMRAAGLKVLPVRPRPDLPPIPLTVANVVEGKYPYQLPLIVAVHPKAPPEAMEAALAMRGKEVGKDLAEHGWIVEGVSRDPAAALEEVWPPPDPKASPPTMQGAVAVLPTRPMSLSFLMAAPADHAFYEDKVAEGVRGIGGWKLLDREQIGKVLEERKLGASGSAGPILSADILVLIHVVTEATTACLRVQAFHAGTATCLGEMKLPIDASRPTEFSPSLERRVAQWWPGVLRSFQAACNRPIWSLRILPGRLDGPGDPAATVAPALAEALLRQDRVFLARHVHLRDAQREMLMCLMGLARVPWGDTGNASDYALTCRAEDANRVRVQVLREVDQQVLAQATFDMPEGRSQAVKWVEAQAAEMKHTPGRSAASAPSFDALKKMAQAAFKLGDCERAWHLDPTNEEVSYEVVRTRNRQASDRLISPESLELHLDLLAAAEHFLSSFPASKRRAEVLEAYLWSGINISQNVPIPRGLDAAGLRASCLRKALGVYADVLGKSVAAGTYKPYSFWRFEHYLYHARKYVELARPSKEEIEAMVKDWAGRFDKHAELAPPSDFLRLIVLAKEKDKDGCVRILGDLRRRWPDPNQTMWRETRGLVIESLFSLGAIDNDSTFDRWLRGQPVPGLPATAGEAGPATAPASGPAPKARALLPPGMAKQLVSAASNR